VIVSSLYIDLIESIRSLVLMLAPMAPHISSEFWEILIKNGPSLESEWAGSNSVHQEKEVINVHQQTWPKYDPTYLIEKERTIAIMV
jgi:leucyl-tRNA synthetase